MDFEVRVCDDALVVRLLAADLAWRDRRHLVERWAMQQSGDATLLLALSAGGLVGRATVLHASKYGEVRLGLVPLREVNAVEAVTQGRGIGTALLGCAEKLARTSGVPMIGLAVDLDNGDALRLYRRLGYVPWSDRHMVDVWDEIDAHGNVVRTHRDECLYLVKPLG